MEEKITITIRKAGNIIGEKIIETQEGLVSLISMLCDSKQSLDSSTIGQCLDNINLGVKKVRRTKRSSSQMRATYGDIIYTIPNTKNHVRQTLCDAFYEFLCDPGSKTFSQCLQFFRMKLEVSERGLSEDYARQVLYHYVDYLEHVAKRIDSVINVKDGERGWKVKSRWE